MYILYIVSCADSTLYYGITNDLSRRIREHNTGVGAKYTKSRRPVHVVYQEVFEGRGEALRREYAIKQLSRDKKLQLIRGNGT